MYLILSISSSATILILFRLFKTYKVNTKQAIVFNYISAFCVGLIASEQPFRFDAIINSNWLFGAAGLGLLFICVFNLMAITAQRNGLSVVSVASKMSVIIPISVGVMLYQEVLSTFQVVGIILALVSVYLVSIKSNDTEQLNTSLLLPTLVFFGSGIIDSALKYFETYHLTQEMIALFSACIFLFAAIFGAIWIFGLNGQNNRTIQIKNISAGVLLGVVNYYSIYFLIQALKINWLNSATVFTINNVTIVAVSSIIGVLLFKETISKVNLTGIVLALLSIILISTVC